MLYFAYGMNTNPSEMALRCPGAQALGHARLVNHSFRFAVHADVEPCADSYVDGVLWEISQDNLQALDQLEGYPHYYTRVTASAVFGARTFHVLVYRMQPGHAVSAPSRSYFDTVTQGYLAFDVPLDQLENSYNFSITNFG